MIYIFIYYIIHIRKALKGKLFSNGPSVEDKKLCFLSIFYAQKRQKGQYMAKETIIKKAELLDDALPEITEEIKALSSEIIRFLIGSETKDFEQEEQEWVDSTAIVLAQRKAAHLVVPLIESIIPFSEDDKAEQKRLISAVAPYC